MFHVVANKHKIIVADFNHRVANNTGRSFASGDEIQFKFLMTVYGVVEALFIAVNEIKTVFVR